MSHSSFLSLLATSPNYRGLRPDSKALPGGQLAQALLGGVMFWALLFTVAGMVASAGLWGIGAFSSNYNQSVNGKRMFLICAGSALFIGAAWSLVDWFYGAGKNVR